MGKYDDIINLPNPESTKHKRMSMQQRAAQFSPFAALTGYSDEINEEARLVDSKMILDEEEKELLDIELRRIIDELGRGSFSVRRITYFVEDDKKEGGRYVEETCEIVKFDAYNKCLMVKDEKMGRELRKIAVDDIVAIIYD